jgi:hypothetical protein
MDTGVDFMKNKLWIATIAVLVSAAGCNLTDGDCYPVGQAAGSGEPGGGVIVSTGSGPSGDAPQGQAQAALSEAQCNSAASDTPVHADPAASCPTSGGPTDGSTYGYCDSDCAAQCGSTLVTGTFTPSIFKFVTTLPDDGKDKGGGWQVAHTTLTFDRWTGLLPESWTCDIAFGIPVRTKTYGVISPAYASVVAADVANQATSYLMHNPNEIPPGAFCALLPGAMNQMLLSDAVYKRLGAQATRRGEQ